MSQTSGISRESLWRRAAALAAEPIASTPCRYLRGDDAAPWSYEALIAAPDWLTWSSQRLCALARLTGAVAVSRSWRGGIDGEPLQRAAEALGETMLERVLELPDDELPWLPTEPAVCGDGQELARLGAILLLTEAPHASIAAGRLPLPPALAAAAALPPHEARTAVRMALALLAEEGGA